MTQPPEGNPAEPAAHPAFVEPPPPAPRLLFTPAEARALADSLPRTPRGRFLLLRHPRPPAAPPLRLAAALRDHAGEAEILSGPLRLAWRFDTAPRYPAAPPAVPPRSRRLAERSSGATPLAGAP